MSFFSHKEHEEHKEAKAKEAGRSFEFLSLCVLAGNYSFTAGFEVTFCFAASIFSPSFLFVGLSVAAFCQ